MEDRFVNWILKVVERFLYSLFDRHPSVNTLLNNMIYTLENNAA